MAAVILGCHLLQLATDNNDFIKMKIRIKNEVARSMR